MQGMRGSDFHDAYNVSFLSIASVLSKSSLSHTAVEAIIYILQLISKNAILT